MIVDTHEIYLELPAMIIDIYSVACFYTNTKKIVFVLSWELIIPVYLWILVTVKLKSFQVCLINLILE
jgi:hypothetical protein